MQQTQTSNKNRYIIVHGFKSIPNTNWKPWLKSELEKSGAIATVPKMPNTLSPEADKWVARLAKEVKSPDTNTYLIGHSLGSITILRYLETLADNQRIGGCLLIAGFGQKFDFYRGGHDSFFDHDLDWQKIKNHCDNFTAIHSDDDTKVEPAQLKLFERELNAKTVMTTGMGHFSSLDMVFEPEIIKEEALKLAR